MLLREKIHLLRPVNTLLSHSEVLLHRSNHHATNSMAGTAGMASHVVTHFYPQ